jgi:hypothetical protein
VWSHLMVPSKSFEFFIFFLSAHRLSDVIAIFSDSHFCLLTSVVEPLQ